MTGTTVTEGTVLWATCSIVALIYVLMGLVIGESILGLICFAMGGIFAVFSFITVIVDK